MKLKNLRNKNNLSCLICTKKCGKKYTTIKYSYENDKIGEVYICEECSKEYDVEEMNLNEQSI